MQTDIVDIDALVAELLGTDEGRADPYGRYQAMRSAAPAHYSSQSEAWYLTGYHHCKDVLHYPRFGRGTQLRGDHLGGLEDTETARRRLELTSGTRNMLFADPPDHTRLRGLVSGHSPRDESRDSGPGSPTWSNRSSTRWPNPRAWRSWIPWPFRCLSQ